jgi:hypothetical protein
MPYTRGLGDAIAKVTHSVKVCFGPSDNLVGPDSLPSLSAAYRTIDIGYTFDQLRGVWDRIVVAFPRIESTSNNCSIDNQVVSTALPLGAPIDSR